MSEASKEYQYSLVNPFGDVLACIPNSPVLMTSRRQVFAKGTFSTSILAGAAGFGFVIFRPFLAAANDSDCVVSSSAAYNASTISDIAAPAGATLYNSNAEFQASEFGLGLVQYRLVSAGVRVRCISSNFKVAGDVVGVQTPDHSSLNGLTQANVKSFKESNTEVAHRIQDRWFTVLYSPVTSTDLDFKISFAIAPAPDTGFMGFAINGGTTDAQSYDFECYANFEYQGNNITGRVVSHDDPVGHAAAAATMKSQPVLLKPHTHDSHELAKAAVHHSASYAAKHISGSGTESDSDQKSGSVIDNILHTGEKLLGPAVSLLSMFGL